MKNFCIICIYIFTLFACNSDRKINIPKATTGTIKLFDDADKVLSSWSGENSIIAHVISEPDNLHPTNGNSSPRSEILQYTQRTLMYIDFSEQTILPGLVKSLPEISADGLHYTYTLRDGISWDDGSVLSTADIIFTAKAFKCQLTNNPGVRIYWTNVADVIVDQQHADRFTIVMKKRFIQNVSFLASFSILQCTFHDPGNILSAYTFPQLDDTAFISTPHPDVQGWATEYNNDKYGRDPAKLNGLGMYKVTEWAAGQYITLVKKKNHWTQNSTDYHEVAFPEKIIFKLNKDDASQLLEFRSQKMDVSVNISTNTLMQLNADEEFQKNYNSSMMPTYNYSYICFNERPDGSKHRKLFDDVKVRKALAMLTPVDNLMKLTYRQYSDQCKRVVSNVSPLKKEFKAELKPIPFDVIAAQKLLSEAGWNDSDGDGILDKNLNGEKISMIADLNYMSSSPEWKDMAMLIMEEMSKAGIKINPVAMDVKLFLEKAKAHDFDLMLGSWGGTGLPEDYTQLWHTTSWTNHAFNYSGFGNEETDAIIDSIKFDLNDSIRIRLSHRLQEKIYADQPYIFLFTNLRRNIIHKRFGNQMIFSERPGLLENMLRLLSINKGITMRDEVSP